MRFVFSLFLLFASPTWADCPPHAAIERELIEDACCAALASGALVNAPVRTIAELDELVARIFLPLEDFETAYENLSVDSWESDVDQTTTITYDLAGRSYQSWAYTKSTGSTRAALIIPGSGVNQSSAIFRRDPANYHYDIAGITEAEGWDTYVYIKPNEDCLAIHNGVGKLCNNCLMPRLIKDGGSYSARYLVDALAWVKKLKTQYVRTVVIGLSQGGAAALLTALKSEPDGAFVASGWSVLRNGCSGLDQIIMPAMGGLLQPSTVYESIQGQDTRYTFSWGRKRDRHL